MTATETKSPGCHGPWEAKSPELKYVTNILYVRVTEKRPRQGESERWKWEDADQAVLHRRPG